MSGKPSASTSTAFTTRGEAAVEYAVGDAKVPCPRIEQQTHVGHVVIGHGKIDRAIAFQIHGADGGWARSTRDRSRRCEVAVPAAEQHAHAVTELIGDRQVQRTVAVQIGCREGTRCLADREGPGRGGRTVTWIEQYLDAAVRLLVVRGVTVRAHQVSLAVTIDIGRHQAVGTCTRHIVDGRREGAVPVIDEHTDSCAIAIRGREIRRGIPR